MYTVLNFVPLKVFFDFVLTGHGFAVRLNFAQSREEAREFTFIYFHQIEKDEIKENYVAGAQKIMRLEISIDGAKMTMHVITVAFYIEVGSSCFEDS